MVKKENRAQFFEALIEHAEDAIVGKTPDGIITSWNAGATALYGYTKKEAIGKSITFLALPEHHDEIMGLLEQIKKGKRIKHYETFKKTKDGKKIKVSLSLSPIYSNKGKIIGASAISRDLSKQEQDKQFRLVVERSPNAIVMADGTGTIVMANPQTSKLFEYTPKELIGKKVEVLVPLRFRGHHTQYRHDFYNKPEARPMGAGRDLFGLKKDGTEIPVEIGLNPIQTAEGLFVVATIIDITERKEAEKIIAAKTKELETLLYVTSHDLREPIRAIESFSQIIQKYHLGDMNAEAKNLFERIIKAADRMNLLLEDVLMLSRLQRVETVMEGLDARIIVQEAVERLEETIREKKAKVTVAHDFLKLKANRLWATQAVYNLLTNALKFTREGVAPEIEIGPWEKTGIVVRDRGTGIPEEHRERIFELFQRAVDREVEGVGAGLAIVKAIAILHGGKTWMQPRKGGGSEFIITFG